MEQQNQRQLFLDGKSRLAPGGFFCAFGTLGTCKQRFTQSYKY